MKSIAIIALVLSFNVSAGTYHADWVERLSDLQQSFLQDLRNNKPEGDLAVAKHNQTIVAAIMVQNMKRPQFAHIYRPIAEGLLSETKMLVCRDYFATGKFISSTVEYCLEDGWVEGSFNSDQSDAEFTLRNLERMLDAGKVSWEAIGEFYCAVSAHTDSLIVASNVPKCEAIDHSTEEWTAVFKDGCASLGEDTSDLAKSLCRGQGFPIAVY